MKRRVLSPLRRRCAVQAGCCAGRAGQCLPPSLPLLSAVLAERNTVLAVPDCCDQEILARKDAYGTLDGDAWLTRGAAAAMLSRVIDSAQRLTIALTPLELCRDLLEIAPATVLMTVADRQITADQFMPALAETLF